MIEKAHFLEEKTTTIWET
jgi:DNA repair exonuclease SbcCD ATPase subunit